MALDDILVTVGADVSGYIQGLERAAAATRGFESNLKTSGSAVKSQTDAVNRQSSSLRNAGSAQDQYAGRVRISREAVKRQGVDLEAADKALEEYIQSVTEAEMANITFASGIVTASALVAAAMGTLILAASNFEDAFIGVQKTVEGTPEQFAALEAEIRGLSKEMPRSASEIAGVAEEAGRLGIKREDIAQFTKTMIMMGDASDLSASQAAQSMARFMNIMNTSEDDVERLGSAITHMGNNAATSESEILELSRRLAGAGNQVGLAESEVVALAASMSELGIRAEAGGTAMQKTLLTMNTAVMQGGEELETFARVAGMSAEEFQQAFEQDAKQAIIAFVAGLDEVSESGGDIASTLDEVGLSNERTMDTLMRLSSSHENLASNMKMSEEAWDRGTALSEEAGKRYESLTSTIKILINRVMDMALTIGQPLMSALKSIITALEPFLFAVEGLVEIFSSLSEGTQKTIAVIALLTPAITALLGVIMIINSAWKIYAIQVGLSAGASGILTGAVGLLGAALVALRGALSLLLGPVGWIIAGITALGAGITWLVGWFRKASEEEKEFTQETDQLAESTENLNNEIKESRDAHVGNLQEIQASSLANKELTDDILALSDAEKMSADDKSLLNSKIEELNGNVEGLNLAYDEQTDSLNMSKDVLQDRLDLMDNESKLIASQERLAEISKERNKADLKLEEINKHREKLLDIIEKQGHGSQDLKDSLEDLDEQEEQLNETHKSLGLQYEVVGEQIAESQAKVTQAIVDGVKNQTLSYNDLSAAQQELVEDMSEGYLTIRDSATEMFEKISTEAEKSVDEMIEILEHNIESTQNWADNLDTLAEQGASHLVEHFREAGPESAAQLQAVVDGGEEKMSELEGKLDEGSRVASEATLAGLDIEEDVVELLARIVRNGERTFSDEIDAANFDQYGKNAVEEFESGVSEKENDLAAATELLVQAGLIDPLDANVKSSSFEKYGNDTVKGLRDGIDNNKDSVTKVMEATAKDVDDAYTGVLSIKSPSRVMFSHGQDTIQGLIDGLDNMSGGLISTVGGIFSDMLGLTDDGLGGVESRSDQGVNSIDSIFGRLPGNINTSMVSMTGNMRTQGSAQAAFMGGLPSRLTSPFSGFRSTMSSIGSNGMSGLLGGLNSMVGSVMSKARSIASSVASTMKGALKVKSPSRVTMGIGSDTTEGLVIGLDSKVKDVVAVSKRMAEAATPDDIKLGEFDYDYKAQNRRFDSFDGAVKGSVNVDAKDGALIEAIRELRRDMTNLRVEMEGESVGRIVRPHVNDGNAVDATVRRYFD